MCLCVFCVYAVGTNLRAYMYSSCVSTLLSPKDSTSYNQHLAEVLDVQRNSLLYWSLVWLQYASQLSKHISWLPISICSKLLFIKHYSMCDILERVSVVVAPLHQGQCQCHKWDVMISHSGITSEVIVAFNGTASVLLSFFCCFSRLQELPGVAD